ncbi:Mss4-like protein, partial [Panaeolus papilionaceus]
CHCGISTFRVPFDPSLLPIQNHACHCNTCRHSSGQMAFIYLPIQGRPLDGTVGTTMVAEGDLNGYRTGPRSIRYFCSNCSAGMFLCEDEEQSTRHGEWYVAAGTLEYTKGIYETVCHAFVGDTLDGGLADQLPVIGDRVMPRFSAAPHESPLLPLPWRSSVLPSRGTAIEAQTIDAYCQCRTIHVRITRPNELSFLPRAPYPDLIFPADKTRLSTLSNVRDEKWWLPLGDGVGERTPTPSHYLAGHCVCAHCRLGSGFEVQSWAFISRANVFEIGSTEPIEFAHLESRPKGMKQYMSSTGRYREFCSKCGATAFWWHAGRPDVIDISMGLIDQECDGARAEEWFKWHRHRVSYSESSSIDRYIVDGLVNGL